MSWPSGDRRRRRWAVVPALALAGTLSLSTAAAPAGARPRPSPLAAPTAPTALATPAVVAELPDPAPTPEEARRRADEILAGNEYEEPPETIAERIFRWILERAGDALEELFGTPAGTAAGKGANPLAWVLVAALVAAVVFLIWKLRGSLGRRRRADEDPLVVTELEALRTATDWLREADRCEQAGEWKEGLRCRYRALIGDLLERGLVRDLPGRTSGEFRTDVRRRAPDALPAFRDASELFDAAWYGDRPTGAAESRAFQQHVEEVLALAPAATPATLEPTEPPPSPDDNQLVATAAAPASPSAGLATGLEPDRRSGGGEP